MIEDIYPENWQATRGVATPAKKIDLGTAYLILVSGHQVEKNEFNEAFTDDVVQQTERIFHSLERTLQAAGASINDVVKSQIFLTDINDYPEVSAVRDRWFAECKPANTLVQVLSTTRKGAKVEIEVTAVVQKG